MNTLYMPGCCEAAEHHRLLLAVLHEVRQRHLLTITPSAIRMPANLHGQNGCLPEIAAVAADMLLLIDIDTYSFQNCKDRVEKWRSLITTALLNDAYFVVVVPTWHRSRAIKELKRLDSHNVVGVWAF